ncbi:MAG: AmmeMemoRadiSam system radical SAM enzyme, partial [Deltaproteobacteria bacterium]|nr:AmmeMemoRadiSam system radical SAM enzyme [Deltaproteobacteria bacterium]
MNRDGKAIGKKALFCEPRPDKRVKCTLCPRYCNIPPGGVAFCFARENRDGTLYNRVWGRPTAVHVDPIEKKPLFHFLPGTDVLSIGTAGCNLGCRFCQNWDLSRAGEVQRGAVVMPPEAVVETALRYGCPSIAFTYNEPTILAEYVMDTAAIARREGIKTVMVTNGYISREAIPAVYENVDAANVDLKAFDDRFYRKQAYGRLQPVLDALVVLKTMGVWIEITTLLIPGL